MNRLSDPASPTRDDLDLWRRMPVQEPERSSTKGGDGPEQGKAPPLAKLPNARSRATIFATEASSFLSLGAASSDSWGKATGAFRGITLGTEAEGWLGAASLFVAARGERQAVSAPGLASEQRDVATVTDIAKLIVTGIDAVETALHPDRAALTALETAEAALTLRAGIADLVGGDDHEGDERDAPSGGDDTETQDGGGGRSVLPEGLLHLHAAESMLLTSGESFTAAKSSTTLGYLNAAVVGGMAARVRGGLSAKLSSVGVASVSGAMAADVTSDFSTTILSRRGRVKVAGRSMRLGSRESGGALLGKEVATRYISAEATHHVGLVAGEPEGFQQPAEVALDGEGNVVAVAKEVLYLEGSGRTCVRGGQHAAVFDDDGIFLAVNAGGSTMGQRRSAAYQTADRMMDLAEQRFRSGVLDLVTGLFAGAVGLSVGGKKKSVWEGVEVLVGGALAGVKLEGTAAGIAFSSARKNAENTLFANLQQSVTSGMDAIDTSHGSKTCLSLRDKEAILQGGQHTAVALEDDDATIIGEKIELQVFGKPTPRVSVKDSEIVLDAGPQGSIVLRAGGHTLRICAQGILDE